jgi:hypothetical protein
MQTKGVWLPTLVTDFGGKELYQIFLSKRKGITSKSSNVFALHHAHIY